MQPMQPMQPMQTMQTMQSLQSLLYPVDMQRFQGRQIARGNGVNGRFKHGTVIYMREQVPVVKHIDPRLAVGQHLGSKCIFNDLARREG